MSDSGSIEDIVGVVSLSQVRRQATVTTNKPMSARADEINRRQGMDRHDAPEISAAPRSLLDDLEATLVVVKAAIDTAGRIDSDDDERIIEATDDIRDDLANAWSTIHDVIDYIHAAQKRAAP